MSDWQDMMVGDRMAVDSEFSPRVEESQFSRQEWGLIMTATRFEVEQPAGPESATLVADTSDLERMMPEIEKVANMGPMGTPQSADDSEGVLESILRTLGLGGGTSGSDGVDHDKLEAAEQLVAQYADELQAHLEAEGRWEKVRAAAAESPTDS